MDELKRLQAKATKLKSELNDVHELIRQLKERRQKASVEAIFLRWRDTELSDYAIAAEFGTVKRSVTAALNTARYEMCLHGPLHPGHRLQKTRSERPWDDKSGDAGSLIGNPIVGYRVSRGQHDQHVEDWYGLNSV